MKTNSTNKIGSFFENVKAEAIHDALKSNNYKGIRRDEIENLLKTKNINEVYKILKSKYKKNNFLFGFRFCPKSICIIRYRFFLLIVKHFT